MVDGVPGGTDSARQKKKSERELDEERGHVQNTSQLLSDAWFIAVLLPRQETAKKKKKVPSISISKALLQICYFV